VTQQKNTSMTTTTTINENGSRNNRRAFTLVELMISIALVLLLILGVNAIFRTTANTIGGGQAAIVNARALRNAYDSLNSDFTGIIHQETQPVLLIYNQNLPGPRDKADEASDAAYLSTQGQAVAFRNALQQYDANGNATNALPIYGYGGMPMVADSRNHRVDVMSFCATGKFRRQTGLRSTMTQTGSDIAYQSDYTTDTAYVWYGHLRQPSLAGNNANNDWVDPTTYLPPGMTPIPSPPANTGTNFLPQTASSNPNNFYANQWVLGRMAFLLTKPQSPNGLTMTSPAGPNSLVVPANPPYEAYLFAGDFHTWNGQFVDPRTGAANAWAWMSSPFCFGNRVTYTGGAIGGAVTYQNKPLPPPKNLAYRVQDSQCDVAGMGADEFLTRARNASLVNNARNYTWYVPLLSVKPDANPSVFRSTQIQDTLRFAGKPWITRKTFNGTALTAAQTRDEMALNASSLIHGCSQFIVEFAGDYIAQDLTSPPDDFPKTSSPYGKIIGQYADGNLDFEMVDVVTPNGTFTQKRVRWYGLPRYYSNEVPPLYHPKSAGSGTVIPADVRPVFDVVSDKALWATPGLAAGAKQLPFEHLGYGTTVGTDVFPQRRPNDPSSVIRSYVCAWSPYDLQFPAAGEDPTLMTMTMPVLGNAKTLPQAYPHGFMPWMIRVTIRVDDPNGRLPDGQTIQYVFTLPHK
jgi:prepilin-type N-terminal cleavage/methylation domain-containing protein